MPRLIDADKLAQEFLDTIHNVSINAERLMEDILAVRNSIVNAESYQNADYGIIMSNLDDIIDMCTYAITNGYGWD